MHTPQGSIMTEQDDDFDFGAFPYVVDAVLDLMPTGPAWRSRFAERPGLAVLPVNDEGFISVLHQGDLVMQIAVSTFRTDVVGGVARVVVDGEWQIVDLLPMPDDPDHCRDDPPSEG